MVIHTNNVLAAAEFEESGMAEREPISTSSDSGRPKPAERG